MVLSSFFIPIVINYPYVIAQSKSHSRMKTKMEYTDWDKVKEFAVLINNNMLSDKKNKYNS
jgi:hypothetical protein